MKKFYIIVIDSGWPTVAHEVLQGSLRLLREYLSDHYLTIFSQEEAQDFIKAYPGEIDKEPIILITDINPKKYKPEKEEKINGIRVDLGKVQVEEEAIRYLQELCKLINNPDFVADISWEERKKFSKIFLKEVVGELFLRSFESFV